MNDKASDPAPAPAVDPLAALKSAELATILGPINNFLTALQAPNVNTESVVQNYASLQLAELQNAPLIESLGINGVAAAIQAKLQAALAASAAPAASEKSV